MADNSPSSRAQPEDEDYFYHTIRGNALKLLPTDFNASALHSSHRTYFRHGL